jgi:hypothetical protein
MGALAIGMSSNVMAKEIEVVKSSHAGKLTPMAFEMVKDDKTVTAWLLVHPRGNVEGLLCESTAIQSNEAGVCHEVEGKISKSGGLNKIELEGNEILHDDYTRRFASIHYNEDGVRFAIQSIALSNSTPGPGLTRLIGSGKFVPSTWNGHEFASANILVPYTPSTKAVVPTDLGTCSQFRAVTACTGTTTSTPNPCTSKPSSYVQTGTWNSLPTGSLCTYNSSNECKETQSYQCIG